MLSAEHLIKGLAPGKTSPGFNRYLPAGYFGTDPQKPRLILVSSDANSMVCHPDDTYCMTYDY